MDNVFSKKGNSQDVAVSSRVRFARNFKDIPFPNSMTINNAQDVKKRILELLKPQTRIELEYHDVNTATKEERFFWVEQHLCSIDLLKTPDISGLIYNNDGNVSVMINEEDHMRIQSISSGLSLNGIYDDAKWIDGFLHVGDLLAYEDKLGYLTSCPTNLGCGFRASVMLAVPALNALNQINAIIANALKLGMICRGFYGEGSSKGGFLQISNRHSMGFTNENIIMAVNAIAKQICIAERMAREKLLATQGDLIKDRLMRSFGVLKYAHQLNARESSRMLCNIYLAKSYGLVDIEYAQIAGLLVDSRDASLIQNHDETIDIKKINIARASFIKERLKNCN